MIAAAAAGLLAGLGIAMPIGAIGTYLVALGAGAPARISAAAALGVASTDGLYALAAVAGGAALESVLRPAATWLRWTSVVVLCVLAAVTLRGGARRRVGAVRPAARLSSTPARTYLLLLGLTALNPATLAYFTSLVLGRQSTATSTVGDRAAFVVGVFLASAAWQSLLVRGGAVLGHVLEGDRGRLAIAVISSAVMLSLAVVLAV